MGLGRHRGQHACAYVISDTPVDEVVPLTTISGTRCTGPTAEGVEASGLVKYDFLCLTSLRDLSAALGLVQARCGRVVPEREMIEGKRVPRLRLVPLRSGGWADVWDLPEDRQVFADVAGGRTETVFQFNTFSARNALRHFNHRRQGSTRLLIDSIRDKAVFTALDRPGPLNVRLENPDGGKPHNALVEFSRRARGLVPSPDIPEVLSKLMPETYGVLCVARGAYVHTFNGLRPIEEVAEGERVLVEDGSWRSVVRRIDNGIKAIVEVRLTNGVALRVTADHPILCARGWVEAGELTKQDLVAQFWAAPPLVEEGDEKDWLVGLLLADGNLCASTPDVSCESESFALQVKEIADRAWGLDCRVWKAPTVWKCILRHKCHSGTTPNPLTRYLRDIGIMGLDCYTKRFPLRVSKMMLTGFFEGDGCEKNGRVRLKNELLARDFWLGLQGLRMPSAFFLDSDGAWTVSVVGELPLKIKKYSFNKAVHRGDYVPNQGIKIPRSDQDRQWMRKPIWGRRIAERLAEKYGGCVDPRPWGRVLSVKAAGMSEVYDLSVEGVHSFVVGGSIVHNCFQEQLQYTFQRLVGCTLAEAEEFRREVAKKHVDKVLAWWPKFVAGMRETVGATEEQAREVWDFYRTWAQYGFNISHSVCYAVIAYACAYLKRHYPLEWWCAVLRNSKKDEAQEVFWPYVGQIVDLPDIQHSAETWEIRGDRLRAPLSLLDGVGAAAHAELVAGRPYADIRDFCQKIAATKRARTTVVDGKEKAGTSALHRGVCYKLVAVGAMDSLFPAGTLLLDQLAMYEAALAEALGVKRVPVKASWAKLSPLERHQLRKEILPAWSEDLRPVLSGAERVGDGWMWRSLALASGEDLAAVAEGVDELDPLLCDEEGRFSAAVAATVRDVRAFSHGEGKSKRSVEWTVDVGGHVGTYVQWHRKDQPAPDPRAAAVGSVVVLTLFQFTKSRAPAVEDVHLVRGPLPALSQKS